MNTTPKRRLYLWKNVIIFQFKILLWSSNIYNTAVVLDHFCSTQIQYAELNNIKPIIQNLHKDADCHYAYFINLEDEIKL